MKNIKKGKGCRTWWGGFCWFFSLSLNQQKKKKNFAYFFFFFCYHFSQMLLTYTKEMFEWHHSDAINWDWWQKLPWLGADDSFEPGLSFFLFDLAERNVFRILQPWPELVMQKNAGNKRKIPFFYLNCFNCNSHFWLIREMKSTISF